MDFELNSTIGISTDIYLYDFDLETYDFLFSIENERKTFRFNKASYFRQNKYRLQVNVSRAIEYKLFVRQFKLTILYVLENNLGYHDLSLQFKKRNDATVYKGFYSFNIKLYNNSFQWKYLESNTDTDDYSIGWNTEYYNDTFEQIETFEVNTHTRYGLNTLDIDITNILVEIYINSQKVFTFLEQDRKFFQGNHYSTYFNYTCYNRNYLNLTGVLGNYSYNTLRGIRCLSGDDDKDYDRFFKIPLFSYGISVSIRWKPSEEFDIPDEPKAPSGTYWKYTSYRIIQGSTVQTDIGNWTVDFTQIDAEQYEAKFFYQRDSIDEDDFGNWKLKFGDLFTINFNFFRDFIVLIINLILLFLQFLLFLVVASLSFVFMFLGCIILLVVDNIAVYYIYIGLLWIVWWLWELLLWLWSVVLWIWVNIILPIMEWLYTVLLPAIMEAMIIVIAFLLTVFVYVLTLGSIDFWDTYYMIKEILWMIVDFVVEWILVFANNMEALLIFFIWYLINAGLIYFRYLYSRARGHINRAKQLYYTFQIYNQMKQVYA